MSNVKMNTVLLFLLASPLLVLAEKTVDQRLNELKLWLQRWNVQSVETLNEQATALNHLVVATDKVITGLESVLELTSGTSQQKVLLQEHIDIVKGRLAIAAIFSSVYMILSTLYMVVYMVVYIKKCVKKHQQRIKEEEIELMDQKLQERRSKQRAAARAKSGSPQQQ